MESTAPRLLRSAMSNNCRRCLTVLEKCKNMKHLKQAHAQVITMGLAEDSFAVSRLMAFCSDPNYGSLAHAQLLYDSVRDPSLCIRNTMAKASLLHGSYNETVQVYCKLLQGGVSPDNYTIPYVLKACANLEDSRAGAQVHGHVIKLGFCVDTFVCNTLVLMYMACCLACEAREVFDEIPRRNASSWNVTISGFSKLGKVEEARAIFDTVPVKDRGIWGAMISGYVQNNCFKEGLAMFRLMQAEGLEPDEGVLVSALAACARLGAIDIGSWIHHYVTHARLDISVRLGTALIDMYLKCGDLELARKLFNRIYIRDTVCWNVMILGLAMHGDGRGALEMFHQMQGEGLKPDDATFIGLLTACSHSGMVEEGLNIFYSMASFYQVAPRSEHFGCVVDFLSRAGRFREVMEIMERLPSSTCPAEKAIFWRALLSACWKHGETGLAEVAASHLMQLEVHSGVYVLLSNIYNNHGKQRDAWRMRSCMRERGVPKTPGCSSIELGGSVHEFVTGEQMHPKMGEVCSLLDTMREQLTILEN